MLLCKYVSNSTGHLPRNAVVESYDNFMNFPGSSADKESAYNVRDLSLIPGSGRSSGEGTGYPHQHSWASLLAQTVKNLPAMRQIQI